MFVFPLEAMEASGIIDAVVLVAPRSELARARAMVESLGSSRVHDLVPGEASRSSSVRAGLAASPPATDVVVCHDAARPFASPELFRRVVDALQSADGVVPLIPSPDTIKRLDGTRVVETIPRGAVGLAQTPQAFRADALRAAHEGDPKDATDDATLLERAGFRVQAVDGEPENFKITTSEDLDRAEARFQVRPLGMARRSESPNAARHPRP
jgi:2-C-methyl-D-erythritol 4-phosphate cytidylyltransferase